MVRFFILISLGFSPLAVSAIHTWLGGAGDYNDPSKWDKGTVPNQGDDVYIPSGSITFPAGATYEAFSFEMDQGTLIFLGTFYNAANIDIYGSLILTSSVNATYGTDSRTTWEFKGANTNHIVKAGGVELNGILLDVDDSQIELGAPILASYSFSIINGYLDTDGNDIIAGIFRLGGGCNNSNCLNKYLNLNGSTITCSTLWDAEFNYGTANISGDYLIEAPQFRGGVDIVYDEVKLLDYDAQPFGFIDQNLYSRNNTFNKLIIDNIYNTKIAGDIHINQEFEVIHPNTDIIISKEGNGSTNRWTFEGAVSLPIDQGGCLDLTRFIRTSAVSDTFSFYTSTGNLTFDYAYIQAIPTTGGGTFTVKTGYVVGYNTTWNSINPFPSKTLYWVGGTGEWNDASHWSLNSGGSSHSCPPNIGDNVVFDSNSFSGSNQSVTLRYDEWNTCKTITWNSNPHGAQINYASYLTDNPDLYISGNINITALVDIDLDGGAFIMVAKDEQSIASISLLPFLSFVSASGDYLAESDLMVEGISFLAGSFDTQGFDLDITNSLFCTSDQNKSFILNNSIITAGGTIQFGDLFNSNTTVNAGTSHLICAAFQTLVDSYHIVEINNTSGIILVGDVNIHKLILNGSSIRPTNEGINIDSLVLNSDNADVILNPSRINYINQAIVINSPGVNPPEIRSYTSSPASLIFGVHNICLLGSLAFQNIDATSSGYINAPDGIDNGGNTGISFVPTPSYSGTLYWVGGQEYWATLSNWSTGSGRCPANIDPAIADSLIFDNQSFILTNDTIFVDAYRTCKTILFKSSMYTPHLHLGRRLVPKEFIIDGSVVTISNNTNVQPFASLWVDEGLFIKNIGALIIKDADVISGRRPNNLTTPALLIDNTSALIGYSGSVLGVAGASNIMGMKTVDLHSNASIYMNLTDFYIVPPIGGQPLRDINLDFSGRTLKSFNTTVIGSNQKYTLMSDLKTNTVSHKYGEIVVEPGVVFRVEN